MRYLTTFVCLANLLHASASSSPTAPPLVSRSLSQLPSLEQYLRRYRRHEESRPVVYAVPVRGEQSSVTKEVDLLYQLTKAALLLVAPLAAAWHGWQLLEQFGVIIPGGAGRQRHVPTRIPTRIVNIYRQQPRHRFSAYSLLHSVASFAAEFGLLYATIEYTKHYVFTLPKDMQPPTIVALWLLVTAGSKLFAGLWQRVAHDLLRLPRPSILHGCRHGYSRVRRLLDLPVRALAALGAAEVWEANGFKTGTPVVLWFFANLALGDVWALVRMSFAKGFRQGFVCLRHSHP